MGSLLLAANDLLEPDRADPRISLSVLYVLLGLGFAMGVLGHIARARWLVAAGIVLIVIASVLLPLLVGSSR